MEAVIILLVFFLLLCWAVSYKPKEEETKHQQSQLRIDERTRRMKKEHYELNKAVRKEKDEFEKILVKLEDEYGSESIPHGNLEIDHVANEVRIDGTKVGGIVDIRTLVEEARKEEEKLFPKSKVSSKLKVTRENNTFFISLNNERWPNIDMDGSVDETAENLANQMEAIDNYLVENYNKYMAHIDLPDGFYRVAMQANLDVEKARQAYRDFTHNKQAKKTLEETGEYVEYIKTEYPWNTFPEVSMAEEQAKRVYTMFMKKAIENGFEVKPIEIGKSYTKNIGGKQKTSHPQRTAALRCGLILSDPVTFTIIGETDVSNNYHVQIGEEVVIATLGIDDTGADFYIKTFMPTSFKEYFEKHEFMDELYKDNPEPTLQELADLMLWK